MDIDYKQISPKAIKVRNTNELMTSIIAVIIFAVFFFLYISISIAKLTNRVQPIRVTEINDIEAALQKELTLWFEQRVKEVQIDPNSQDNALENNSIIRFIYCGSTTIRRKQID